MTQESSTGAAVALRPEEQNEIDEIRRRGAFEVARKTEVEKVFKQIQGLEWGSGHQLVKGSEMSQHARAALAHFCVTVGAHPQLHVNILGGKPWLNTEYFSDRLNSEERFIDFRQVDISQNAELRQHYGVPEHITHAYETIIRKLVNFAPIEKIRSGEITDWERYVVEVREANWAGGKGQVTRKKRDGGTFTVDADPVGDAEPAKTARTRSLRRAAVRAFPTWMEKYEAQIEKAEEILEAEYEIIQDDRRVERAALPQPGGPQGARTGAGEPTAANPAPASARANVFENDDARTAAMKSFFGTLRDAGVDSDDRASWATARDLPASVSSWGPAEYEKAKELLLAEARADFEKICDMIGVDAGDFAQTKLGHAPETVREYRELRGLANESADTDSAQGTLV